MSTNERTEWDRRYREGTHQSLTPDPFLVGAYEEFIAPSFPQPGRALDLAGGVGRHAIFLAERGWEVTLIDISPTALESAKSEAGKRGLHLSAELADLAETPLPLSSFDLVLNFFYLERALFPPIIPALKSGCCPISLLLLHAACLSSNPFHNRIKKPLGYLVGLTWY